jgi:hypothetical protein
MTEQQHGKRFGIASGFFISWVLGWMIGGMMRAEITPYESEITYVIHFAPLLMALAGFVALFCWMQDVLWGDKRQYPLENDPRLTREYCRHYYRWITPGVLLCLSWWFISWIFVDHYNKDWRWMLATLIPFFMITFMEVRRLLQWKLPPKSDTPDSAPL